MENEHWGKIIGLVLVALFMFTLLTIKTDPPDNETAVRQLVSEYSFWQKYELNGMRTTYDDHLIVKFRNSVYDVQYNDSFIGYEPYFIYLGKDSTLVMKNTFFFNDTITSLVQARLLGENDMLVYPYQNTKFDTTYIYLKRRLPYQY